MNKLGRIWILLMLFLMIILWVLLEGPIPWPELQRAIYDLTFAWRILASLLLATFIFSALGIVNFYRLDILNFVVNFTGGKTTRYYREGNISLEIINRLKRLESSQTTGIAEKDLSKIQSAVTSEISNSIVSQMYSTFELKFGEKAVGEERNNSVLDSFGKILAGLEQERKVVSTRNYVNLLVGVGVAISGIYILYGLISIDYLTEDFSIKAASLQFFSRLSVAIIAEVFAYFFLNLYRTGLQEMRFFRNEITNVQSREIAYQLAIHSNDAAAISKIIEKMTDTERNFVLKKGETTVGASQNTLDREQDNAMLKTLSDTFTAGVKSVNGKD